MCAAPAKQLKKTLETDDDPMPPVSLVKGYCMHRNEVDFNSTALHFTDVGSKDLSRCFPRAMEFCPCFSAAHVYIVKALLTILYLCALSLMPFSAASLSVSEIHSNCLQGF